MMHHPFPKGGIPYTRCHFSRLNVPFFPFNGKIIALFSALGLILFSIVHYTTAPNTYSATHLLFDYRFGFIRRALVGEIISWFVAPQVSYAFISYFSYAIFTLESLILFALFYRTIDKAGTAKLLLAFYFGSFAFAYYAAFLIGYLDHVLIILVMILGFLPVKRPLDLFLFVTVCAAGMCIHEIFFVLVMPILMARWVIAYCNSQKVEIRKIEYTTLITSMAVLLLLYYALCQTTNSIVDTANLEAIKNHAISKADFLTDPSAFDIFKRSAQGNGHIVRDYVLQNKEETIHTARKVGSRFLAFMFIFSGLSAFIFSTGFPNKKCILGAGALLFLPATPLIASLMGWDFLRWGAHTNTLAFLMLLMVIRSSPEPIKIRRYIIYSLLFLLATMRWWRLHDW